MNGVETKLGAIQEAILNIKQNIQALFHEREKQTRAITELDTKVDVFKNTFENTKKTFENQFEDVEGKLANDYRDLKEIKKIKAVREEINKFKMSIREFIKWVLYVIVAVFAIVTSVNTILEIKDRVINNKGVSHAVRSTTGHPG